MEPQGEVVWHHRLGKGVVVDLRWDGQVLLEVRAIFGGGLTAWVKAEDVHWDGSAPTLQEVGPEAKVEELRPAPVSVSDALKAVHTLRYGQPPVSHIKALTVGVSELTEGIGQDLDEVAQTCRARVLVLVGPFGSGKTHLANVAARLGRERAFWTSLVEVTEEHNFEYCVPLYREITKRLTAPTWAGALGIDQVLDAVLSGDILGPEMISFERIGPAFEAAINARKRQIGGVVDLVADYVTGELSCSKFKRELFQESGRVLKYEGLPIDALKRVDRPERFATLLAEWSRLVRLVNDRRGGLLVGFDELDLSACVTRTAAARSLRAETLVALMEMVKREKAPLYLVLASTDEDGTEIEAAQELVSEDRVRVHEIELPPRSGFVEVGRRVAGVYREAYKNDALPADLEERLDEHLAEAYESHVNLRTAVRTATHFLDVITCDSMGAV